MTTNLNFVQTNRSWDNPFPIWEIFFIKNGEDDALLGQLICIGTTDPKYLLNSAPLNLVSVEILTEITDKLNELNTIVSYKRES